MRNIRYLISLILLIAIGLMPGILVNKADAASSSDITVTVAILPNLSVNVPSNNSWNFTAASESQVYTMTNSNKIIVQNDGNTSEKFTLQITNSGNWTAGTIPALNTYVMKGLFVSDTNAAVVEGDFGADGTDDDIIQTSPGVASAALFGLVSDAQNGTNVTPGDQRALWLQLLTPTAVADLNSGSIVITIGVTAP